MGYVVKKARDTKSGKTTVRLRADGTPYWQLVYEDRRKERAADTPREQIIHRNKLLNLGIDDRLTFDQVKAICKSLNSKANLNKKNERARVKSLARENQDDLIQSAFLPPADVREFEEKILIKRFAGSAKTAAFNKLLFHWKYAQRMIAELQMEPRDYADESMRVFRYFQEQKISPAYTVKVLRMLNAWGQFYTKKHGGTGIEEVKNPRGKPRQDIARAYHKKKSFKGPADPLTPDELTAKSKNLIDYNQNWLFLSVWLGLRPEEIDNLHDKKLYEIALADDSVTSVLWVFQTKLTSVEEEKAWKAIPLFHVQQRLCLEIIKSGNFKRPLNKTLRKVFPTKRITGYSGRKGFTDLFLTLGQPLEEISLWLGHTSIEMTWKRYKSKQVVRFKQVA